MDTLHTRLLRLYDNAQQATVDEFAQSMLPELRAVVGFDSAAIYSLTLLPDKSIRFNACLSEADARDKLEYRVRELRDGHMEAGGRVRSRDRLIERGFNQPGRSFFLDTRSVGDRELLEYTRRFKTEHAFLHATRMGREVGVLSLWRSRRPDAFQLADAARGDVLIPHLFKALQINRKITDLGEKAGNGSAWQIVCDEQGGILFSDEGANTLLGQEWAQWSLPRLPTPFLHDLMRQGHYQGRCLRATVQSSARLFVIRLQAVAAGQQLTPAELIVARLAARDLSYKEVARELGTSPATVRNQLHSVYGKLNISGKAALSHALRAA
ncbi:helix-turn-helix domain-containing protein [Curvibacter gracilis]|uniref:helix-turn-helix domain-containing protein n=1 Tax=Curvibacter gracilis TaxID=230310 RepID=UPI0004853FF1|nr:helix-turn-helix transcriptional regulator [Curvibacter gracilis]